MRLPAVRSIAWLGLWGCIITRHRDKNLNRAVNVFKRIRSTHAQTTAGERLEHLRVERDRATKNLEAHKVEVPIWRTVANKIVLTRATGCQCAVLIADLHAR